LSKKGGIGLTLGKILVVDDEETLRDMLFDALTIAQYDPIVAVDGADARIKLRQNQIDLVVADINMPNVTGLELLEMLRESGNQVPVILLTAQIDRHDVTAGLKTGADDYIKKPFGLEELILRIEAVLRRTRTLHLDAQVLTCGPIVLNRNMYVVTFNDEVIELSPTEFKLLDLLMANQNKVVRKSELLSDVWDIDFDTSTNVVDTYISYLRKKLHRDGFEGIRTIRGIGFQIEAPV